ncbi:MFS transporter [Streptomyces sp. NBC_00239]|uniref:MFS transporter n=1 Tax=Streptomyces sp. NBC_00239 TaxID=2903640 RepID=UPI003FA72AEB
MYQYNTHVNGGPVSIAERRAALHARIPGGRDGRRILWISLVDKTGTGLWAGAAALYFVTVAGLGIAEVGLLVGISGAAGIAGAPLGGRLADRFPLTRLLVALQLLRFVSALALLTTHQFWPLLAYSALGSLGDRAANVLTKLYAARISGPDRVRYQAINRTSMNIGYAIGGLAAAAALGIGTPAAYRALLLGDALSFLAMALLTLPCAEPPSPTRTFIPAGPTPKPAPSAPANPTSTGPIRIPSPAPPTAADPAPAPKSAPPSAVDPTPTTKPAPGATTKLGSAPAAKPASAPGPGTASAVPAAPRNPWRDRTYLLFSLTEAALFLDDAVFKVGIPLWIVHATEAPHGLAPLLMVLNSVLVVIGQVPLARFGATTDAARRLLRPLAAAHALGCLALAASAFGGPWTATAALCGCAVALTLAEMLHATASWELSLALAPDQAQGAYLGVHGLAASVQRSAGPLIATAAVAAGPLAWAAMGAGLAATCRAQDRLVRRATAAAPPLSVPAITLSEH